MDQRPKELDRAFLSTHQIQAEGNPTAHTLSDLHAQRLSTSGSGHRALFLWRALMCREIRLPVSRKEP